MEAKDYVQALIDRGMTQREIAEATGIAQPTVSKIALGKVEDVLSKSYRRLQALYERQPAESADADTPDDPLRRASDQQVVEPESTARQGA